RYHEDLDRVADHALRTVDDASSRPGFEQITVLASAIAQCAVAHPAAIQIAMYETPSSNPDLIKWTQHRPTAVLEAMYQVLRAGRWAGYIRSDIDLRVLADRVSQTMLQVGLYVVRHNAAPDRVARLLCRMMLEGLAAGRPSDAELSQSAAFRAADRVIQSWTGEAEPKDKAAYIRAVARAEFGRRGYEGTTVRDIAAATGIGHGTVFRLIGSKEDLLASIMGTFGRKTEEGSSAVLRSDSSPVEKLDALSWVNINALDRFGDEFRIQLAWMRQIPPDAPNPSVEFPVRLRQTERLLSQGIRSAAVCIDDAPLQMLARCVIGLQWLPENILRDIGMVASLVHVRDTLLRGAAAPAG
ncbi:MAG: TetR/AcrR family transcriptional regulator, partial [Mycobacteriaceae bacterium]|nr:TetR/AcrR family transcriptional regulator [Mycobacteriaceae bacterium]